ncbi:MAG: tRNA-dihydrouridine synthase [Parcubacteria group bacterium]|jgi:nifR3 family TIM-barrel protein
MEKNFWQKLNRPILAVAPMAGITDSAFREMCMRHGCDVAYSEMASVSALFFKPQKTLELLKFNASERPYVVQLFGKDPEHFAEATKIVSTQVKPDGIDINFGCPARKVFGHGSGCALMPQPALTREILTAVCANTDLPVSIKIRAGVKDLSAIQFIENIKDLPFSAVMVHGRTYEGGFSSVPDFAIVEAIKKILPNKIVLANGGIHTPEDAQNILMQYPLVDGLGLARGIWGKPYLFAQIKEILRTGAYAIYNFEKIKKIALEHAELLWQSKGNLGMFEIRKHLSWYMKGFAHASEMRQKLVQAKSVKEIKDILQ